MEVEQINFVTQLMITVHYYIIDYLKTCLLKFGLEIKFQMVIINMIVSCVQIHRKI